MGVSQIPPLITLEEPMLILDPELRLRRGESNIFCYAIDESRMDIVRQRVLHPLEAVVLCLYDGSRSEEEVADLLAEVTRSSREQSTNFLAKFVERSRDMLKEGSGKPRYSPEDFIINNSEISDSRFRLRSPVSLALLLTYDFTSRCQYCYANRGSSEDALEMDIDFAKRIVDQAKDCDVELLYLGGGDPFTKDWVEDIISYVIMKDIALVLSTKEFISGQRVRRLADVGVKRIQVSVDTTDSELASELTGRANCLSEAMATIANLQSAGIEVTTNSVVTKLNYKHIPDLVAHLVSLGITSMVLSRYYRSTYCHADSLFVENADAEWINHRLEMFDKPVDTRLASTKIDEVYSGDNGLKAFLNRARCAFGRTAMVVTPSGKVIPCEQLPTRPPYVLGDLAEQTLQEVWKSEELLAMLYHDREYFEGTVCFECEHLPGVFMSWVGAPGTSIKCTIVLMMFTRIVHAANTM